MKASPLTPIECAQVRNLIKTMDAATRDTILGFSIGGAPANPRQKPFNQSDVRAALHESMSADNADAFQVAFLPGRIDGPNARRKTLICMVGLPDSGKSTHARKLGFPIVCPDAIRLALHGQRFIAEMEPIVWQNAEMMVKSLFGAGHDRVILDACNVTRAQRAQWIAPGQWDTEFRRITTPFEMCLERAENAGDEEIMPVIERMSAQWEPLSELIGEHKIRLFSARGREVTDFPEEWATPKNTK